MRDWSERTPSVCSIKEGTSPITLVGSFLLCLRVLLAVRFGSSFHPLCARFRLVGDDDDDDDDDDDGAGTH